MKHLDVGPDHPPRISPDIEPGEVIEKLVREYTSITGDVGARMCFMACAAILREHAEIDVPSFRPFRRFS